MPKVSVIIPIYGVEQYIEQCARSLFEQTLDDIEFLFIDDCTPDRSVDILKKVLEDYPSRKKQTIIHRMNSNSGQASVRKWGMENAKGEYVIHCDSDDWVELNIYETLFNYAVSTNSDIVYYDFYKSDGEKHTIIKRWKEQFKDKDSFLRLLISAQVTGSVCGALCKRTLYQNNFTYPDANMGEDLAMMLQMAYNSTNRISYISKPLYYYRDNMSSISKTHSIASIEKRLNDNIVNGEQMFMFLQKMGLTNTMTNEIEQYKFTVRKQYLPILNKNGFYKKWKYCYPEINRHYLINKVASIRDKVLFVLCYLRLYHIVLKLRTIMS